MLRRRSVLLALSAAAAVSAAAVCMSVVPASGTDQIVVPSPDAAAGALCGALHKELPATVDGLSRHSLVPGSELIAGWGDPAVVLRCGVRRPDVLTPGSAEYNPTANAVEVDGVSWLLEKRNDGYRFTTTGRKAFVEVTVPGKYAPEVNPLTDLAAAVRKAVPADL